MTKDTQVAIYLENPKGQVLQVSYGDFIHYWRLIGWTLQGEAPMLPLIPKIKSQGLQAGLI
jgi:hypothetical protein